MKLKRIEKKIPEVNEQEEEEEEDQEGNSAPKMKMIKKRMRKLKNTVGVFAFKVLIGGLMATTII